jgi:hypothetical protein
MPLELEVKSTSHKVDTIYKNLYPKGTHFPKFLK